MQLTPEQVKGRIKSLAKVKNADTNDESCFQLLQILQLLNYRKFCDNSKYTCGLLAFSEII